MPQTEPVSIPQEQKVAEENSLISRQADLAQQVSEFQAEEKDAVIQALNQEIHGHLVALQALTEDKAIADKAVVLRSLLEKIMNRREIARNPGFGDKIHQLQKKLTHHWPRNALDAEGKPLDSILQDDSIIAPEDQIESANGYIYNKASLQQYFNTPVSLQRIKKVGFSVMTTPPTQDNLPLGPNSAYVLVQEAPGAEPSALWFVDRSRDEPEIQEINFAENRSASSFAQALFPLARNRHYQNISLLSPLQKDSVLGHIGAEQLIKYRAPEGGWFESRDIANFRTQGRLNIPELTQQVHNRQVGEEVRLALGSMGMLNRLPLLNLLSGLITRFQRFRGLFIGALLGRVIGGLAGLAVAIALIVPVFGALAWPHLLIALGVGIGSGVIGRFRGQGFVSSLIMATVVSLLMLGLVAYLGPIIAPALGIASAATMAASAVWAYAIVPALPLLVAAAAAIGEFFKPGCLRKTFDRIYNYTVGLPATIGAFCGAVLGAATGFLCRDLPYAIQARTQAREVAQLARLAVRLQAAEIPQEPAPVPQDRPLSSNAQVHQVFAGQNAAPSPRTQAAIEAVLNEGNPRSNRAAAMFNFNPDRAAVPPQGRELAVQPVEPPRASCS